MLLSLRIENFALIDQLYLELGAGLTVMTGETGAGKSIILDALDIVLGGKISDRTLRSGTQRAQLEACFQLTPTLTDWLAQAEIEPFEDQQLVCSRDISLHQGKLRSRSRVNGVVINKQQMGNLREHLVEITAQGQTVDLGRPQRQRDWLDGFGGDVLGKQRRIVANAYDSFQRARQALAKHRQNEQGRLRQIDLLQYQLQDLEQADLSDPNELQQLDQDAKRLRYSVDLQAQSQQVYAALYEQEHGAAGSDLLGQAETTLLQMSALDHDVQPILELVQQALTQVQEAGRQINAYGANLETDPERLEEIEARVVQLKQICRKYGPELADAIAFQTKITAELEALTDHEQSLEQLERAYTSSEATLQDACVHLTGLRRTAAQALEKRLLQELKPLAMDNVQFQVAIEPAQPAAHGSDQIQFLFSPNPGEPLQPVAETASGGEMSRFLLALKACSAGEGVGTLIFDEIDVGVSGQVANAIASKLSQLGHYHQVLCVTHQPIVAAMASHHFQVAKQVVGKTKAQERTVVQVTPLDASQRRQELAEIAGGFSAEGALPFVDALLEQAMALQQQTPSQTTPKRRSRKSG